MSLITHIVTPLKTLTPKANVPVSNDVGNKPFAVGVSHIVECHLCNKKISRKAYQLNRRKYHLCSVKCKNSFAGQQRARQSPPRIKKECAICCKTYYVIAALKGSTYCSLKCSSINQRETSKLKRSLMYKNRNLKCANCNTLIVKNKIAKYCSRACLIEYGKINNVSKKEKLIRASSQYQKWRKKVLQRDSYTCQWCYQVGGRLNVDHIKPFSLFPELRTELSNGRTLCECCHKKTDTYGKKIIKVKEVMEIKTNQLYFN